MNYITNWQDVVTHMLSVYPEEGCGYVSSDNVFTPCANVADDRLNTFKINPKELIGVDVKAIIHSHTYDSKKFLDHDPRIPSKQDIIGMINSGVEWGIVITEGENVTQPIWFGDRNHRPDLYDREFIHTAQDCLAFMTDWMYKEYGVDLPYHPRDFDWFEKGENHFEEQYENWGFVDVTDQPRQRGDVTFYKIRARVVNHIGVMLDEHTVGHHLFGKYPSKEPYSKHAKYCTRRIRLKGK